VTPENIALTGQNDFSYRDVIRNIASSKEGRNMRTHRLGLFFAEKQAGELSRPPISQIYVKTPLREKYPGAYS
jgi:hypothetical protein